MASGTEALDKAEQLELLAAAENLFHGRCEVGKTPVTQIGPPPAFRVGTRVTWR